MFRDRIKIGVQRY